MMRIQGNRNQKMADQPPCNAKLKQGSSEICQASAKTIQDDEED